MRRIATQLSPHFLQIFSYLLGSVLLGCVSLFFSRGLRHTFTIGQVRFDLSLLGHRSSNIIRGVHRSNIESESFLAFCIVRAKDRAAVTVTCMQDFLPARCTLLITLKNNLRREYTNGLRVPSSTTLLWRLLDECSERHNEHGAILEARSSRISDGRPQPSHQKRCRKRGRRSRHKSHSTTYRSSCEFTLIFDTLSLI